MKDSLTTDRLKEAISGIMSNPTAEEYNENKIRSIFDSGDLIFPNRYDEALEEYVTDNYDEFSLGTKWKIEAKMKRHEHILPKLRNVINEGI